MNLDSTNKHTVLTAFPGADTITAGGSAIARKRPDHIKIPRSQPLASPFKGGRCVVLNDVTRKTGYSLKLFVFRVCKKSSKSVSLQYDVARYFVLHHTRVAVAVAG